MKKTRIPICPSGPANLISSIARQLELLRPVPALSFEALASARRVFLARAKRLISASPVDDHGQERQA